LAYIARYTSTLKTCLKKFPHLKEKFRNKKDYILKDPLNLGEPLKGNLNGLRSFTLTRNFLVIFIVCNECRRLKQEKMNGCLQCEQTPPETVIFLLFGPHDPAYRQATSSRQNLKDNEFGVFT